MENENENNLNDDNEFCSKEENKNNNKKDAKNQINKISDKFNNLSFIKTNSYCLLNGKITISLSKNEKKELVDKYWRIKPERKFDFYGKDIKNLHNNENISGFKDLIGVLMIFNKLLPSSAFKRFDHYFSIIIKSHERNYFKTSIEIENDKNEKEEEKKIGKILYVGGNLKKNLGNMFKEEFCENNNKDLPIFVSIMVYKEYEEIELDAFDLCNKTPDHHGFIEYNNVFHKSFSKNLSNKLERIKRDKNKRREELLKEEEAIKKNII